MALHPIASVPSTTQQLGSMALALYGLKHRVIAHNVANVDAEGFVPMTVDFQTQLDAIRSAVVDGAPADSIQQLVSRFQPRVAAESDAPTLEPGQQLDEQMVALTQNTLDYEAMLTAITRLGSLTRLAATGN